MCYSLFICSRIHGVGINRFQYCLEIFWVWSNETLAMIALWAGAAYLVKDGKNHWIASPPAPS